MIRVRWNVAAVAGLATGALLLIGAAWAPARAEGDARLVVAQAWTHTGEVPLFLPRGDLVYVARSGTEQARAFVRVDIDGLVDGAVDSAVLELAEGGDELASDGAALSVCGLASVLGANGRIDPDDAPSPDCTLQTFALRSADGVWSVDLTPFLERPELAVRGFAIFPDTADPRPGAAAFRVSFDPRRTTVATATASTPAPPAVPAGETTSTTASAPPRAPSGTGADGSRSAEEPTPSGRAEPAGPETPSAADERAEPPDRAAAPMTSDVAAPPAAVGPPIVNAPPWQLLPIAAVGALTALGAPLAGRRTTRLHPAFGTATRWPAVAVPVVLLAVPAVVSESLVFDLGLVLVFAVAVLGLHVLVHWAGQFSLAHAASVGVPAFVAARVADAWDTSPVHLLPLAVVVGAVLGALLAIVGTRASTYAVTVATLAVALAADRFLFTNALLVGPGTVTVPPAELVGLSLASSRRLWLLLVVLTVAAFAATAALGRSVLGRRIRWSRQNPEGAAAAGIDPRVAIASVYVLAGALAGLAGGLTVMWVGTVGTQSFPLTLAFDLLVVAVVAGAGSVLGVAVAAFLFEGLPALTPLTGPLAAYGGPLVLLLVIVRFPGGLNAAWRNLMERRERAPEPTGPRLLSVLGAIAIATGFGAIALAWYHAGNTDQVWIQTQELISGGIGGLGLVAVGTGLVVVDHLRALRRAIERGDDATGPWEDDVSTTLHRPA